MVLDKTYTFLNAYSLTDMTQFGEESPANMRKPVTQFPFTMPLLDDKKQKPSLMFFAKSQEERQKWLQAVQDAL
ncbi:hypothetical protein Ciccas_008904 [Cichlidogyrus casuarinus]|uniref:PH domain-containing protein n=1 Tax=Cichlidogyrus casuarinus TaxID=1844966 RepID=A0ABD2PZZ4_9PLAT